MVLTPRFFPIPDSSFFLFGPRGTGKTTWLRARLENALAIDLLDPAAYRKLAARPERLEELVAGNPSARTILIDEIQRIPALLNVVHRLVEARPELRFAMTGSSARKPRRGGVNLLGGRALNRSLHPFMAAELPGFDLEPALRTGMLPIVRMAPNPGSVLDAYVTLYLEEEVKAEGWARKIGDFARFLEAVSFSHASVLNLSAVARDCSVGRKTVEGYLDVLQDLLLCFRVPVFSKRARRRTSTHPKFYLFDAGVFRSLRPSGPLDSPGEIDGQALEGLVAQHLRAWLAYSDSDLDLYFWRTPKGLEVDFVLYGADGLYAFEVKGSDRVRPEDLRSLKAFRNDYPECRPALLYRGSERLMRQGIPCLPVQEFLLNLRPGRDLPA